MIDFEFGVTLERIRRVDLPQLREWRNSWDVWRWCRQMDLIDEANHERWFEEQSKDPSISMFLVKAPDEDGASFPVGVCGLTSIDFQHSRAEFSLYVGSEYHGNGYGKRALQTLLSHAFENLGLDLVWGETFEGNPAAGMFEAVGFKYEGTRRQFYWKEGARRDCRLYSILKEEWNP